jgi:hypothetical protein
MSYSREDAPLVRRLATDLKANAFSVWLDILDILPGQDWANEVEKAIEACSVFLVVVSPAAQNSRVVNNEIASAFDGGKPIVPILHEECTMPFLIRTLQYADFSKEEEYQTQFQRLLTVLGRGPNREPARLLIPGIHNRADLQSFLVGTTWRKEKSAEYLEFRSESNAYWGIKGFSAASAEPLYKVITAKKMDITWGDGFRANCVFNDGWTQFKELHNKRSWSLCTRIGARTLGETS